MVNRETGLLVPPWTGDEPYSGLKHYYTQHGLEDTNTEGWASWYGRYSNEPKLGECAHKGSSPRNSEVTSNSGSWARFIQTEPDVWEPTKEQVRKIPSNLERSAKHGS